jgi:hypothetical protein
MTSSAASSRNSTEGCGRLHERDARLGISEPAELAILEESIGVRLGTHQSNLQVGQSRPDQRDRKRVAADRLERHADRGERRASRLCISSIKKSAPLMVAAVAAAWRRRAAVVAALDWLVDHSGCNVDGPCRGLLGRDRARWKRRPRLDHCERGMGAALVAIGLCSWSTLCASAGRLMTESSWFPAYGHPDGTSEVAWFRVVEGWGYRTPENPAGESAEPCFRVVDDLAFPALDSSEPAATFAIVGSFAYHGSGPPWFRIIARSVDPGDPVP